MIKENFKPSFGDFWISKTGYTSANSNNVIIEQDYVFDEHNIAGQVISINEDTDKIYVMFIDGYSDYYKQSELKKITTNGNQIYLNQKREFGLLTKMGRIMSDTLEEFYPFVHMFNNGNTIWIRASTMKDITNKYTTRHFSGNTHSLFSAKMTPRYTCEIETFVLKKHLRKTWFNRELLQNLFQDINFKMSGDSRINWVITDNEDYNKKWWKFFIKKYSKYKINYLGNLNDYDERS